MKTIIWQDPVISEIHLTREKIAARFGNSIHAMCEAARLGQLGQTEPRVQLTQKIRTASGVAHLTFSS